MRPIQNKYENKKYEIHLQTTSITNIRIQQLTRTQLRKGHLKRQPGSNVLEKGPFENLLIILKVMCIVNLNIFKKIQTQFFYLLFICSEMFCISICKIRKM